MSESAIHAMSRDHEIMTVVREAAGDGDVFMAGLVEIAKRDVKDLLPAITDAYVLPDYAKLAALGRQLGSAAALVAGEETRV